MNDFDNWWKSTGSAITPENPKTIAQAAFEAASADAVPQNNHYNFDKDVQIGNFIYVEDHGLEAETAIRTDMETFVPPEYRGRVTLIQSMDNGLETLAWKYTPRKIA